MLIDRITITWWKDTNTYYGNVILPNSEKVELKSDVDLNMAGWDAKAQAQWNASQNIPEPVEEVHLASATDKELLAEVARRKLDIKQVEEAIRG